jgi:hypothetical protein
MHDKSHNSLKPVHDRVPQALPHMARTLSEGNVTLAKGRDEKGSCWLERGTQTRRADEGMKEKGEGSNVEYLTCSKVNIHVTANTAQ